MVLMKYALIRGQGDRKKYSIYCVFQFIRFSAIMEEGKHAFSSGPADYRGPDLWFYWL